MEATSETRSLKSDELKTNFPFTIKVGSRKSQLALIQTNQVIKKLREFYFNNSDEFKKIINLHKKDLNLNSTQINFEILSLQTLGDKVLDKPLPNIGTKSLFTKELEAELLQEKVDFIVHSLKDLPTSLPDGCIIGAVLKRDNPYDTIVLKKSLRSKINPIDLLTGRKLSDQSSYDNNYKIGTSSQRRIAMIRRCNPNIKCIDIRGNLNTRLSKLDNDDGEYTAIILAQAGLDRMNWSDRGSTLLTPEQDINLEDWYYAVGQGAIAVECRSGDRFILDLLHPIVDMKTTYEVIAERSLMKKLEGGCSVPLGVRSSWLDEHCLKLDSIVLSVDGKQTVKASGTIGLNSHNVKSSCDIEDEIDPIVGIIISDGHSIYQKNVETCSKLGMDVAIQMIDKGCLALMHDSR